MLFCRLRLQKGAVPTLPSPPAADCATYIGLTKEDLVSRVKKEEYHQIVLALLLTRTKFLIEKLNSHLTSGTKNQPSPTGGL